MWVHVAECKEVAIAHWKPVNFSCSTYKQALRTSHGCAKVRVRDIHLRLPWHNVDHLVFEDVRVDLPALFQASIGEGIHHLLQVYVLEDARRTHNVNG